MREAIEQNRRVVSHVATDNTHHSAFDVSVRFVNDMDKLTQQTGLLAPKRQGNPGIGKLTPHEDCARARMDDGCQGRDHA